MLPGNGDSIIFFWENLYQIKCKKNAVAQDIILIRTTEDLIINCTH